MPRKARKLSSTGIYHIMGRGVNHMAIYNDDADSLNFLYILDFCADDDFVILGYCLMGNHYHLLVKAEDEALQRVMKAVGVRYVSYYNKRYQRTDPVAAGLVQQMQDYPWSSYLDYFGHRQKPLCHVDTSYALLLRNLEQLRRYHEQPEQNARGILEDTPLPAFTDSELRDYIRLTAGMECCEIQYYPDTTVKPLLSRLVTQEGVSITQLSRLTGLARGDIRRRLL